jgi:hypothetical protein
MHTSVLERLAQVRSLRLSRLDPLGRCGGTVTMDVGRIELGDALQPCGPRVGGRANTHDWLCAEARPSCALGRHQSCRNAALPSDAHTAAVRCTTQDGEEEGKGLGDDVDDVSAALVTALLAARNLGLADLRYNRLRYIERERVDLVGSHGRWKRPCLQTAHMTI